MKHSIETLAALAESHAFNRNWYARHREPFEALTGSTLGLYRFEALLAATSPRMSVQRNARAAVDVFAMDCFGMRPDKDTRWHGMSTHLPNVYRALRGQPLSGPKVSAFERNLHGDWRVPTIDVHMLRLLALPGSYAVQVERAQGIVAMVAAHLEWTPAEAQACLWAYQYRQTNKTTTATDYGRAMRAIMEAQ